VKRLVHIVIDPEKVAQGSYAVGGVKILDGTATDEDIGRGLRTTVVRVHDEDGAEEIRQIVALDDNLELDDHSPLR
jgi:hypothetical protein